MRLKKNRKGGVKRVLIIFDPGEQYFSKDWTLADIEDGEIIFINKGEKVPPVIVAKFRGMIGSIKRTKGVEAVGIKSDTIIVLPNGDKPKILLHKEITAKIKSALAPDNQVAVIFTPFDDAEKEQRGFADPPLEAYQELGVGIPPGIFPGSILPDVLLGPGMVIIEMQYTRSARNISADDADGVSGPVGGIELHSEELVAIGLAIEGLDPGELLGLVFGLAKTGKNWRGEH